MTTNTVRLHRVLKVKPGKVYRAFLDARVGGTYRMAFENFSNGGGHSFGGEYLELVPGELLRYTDKFDDTNLPGIIEVTIALKPALCGTEVHITQAAASVRLVC